MSLDLDRLTTEQRNPKTMDLDIMTPLEIVTVMNQQDALVPEAIKPHLPQIARVVEWAIESLHNGGRMIYMGAGTSGRLGVLDAAECPPTFGVSKDLVIGLIAGGQAAVNQAKEKAEDSEELGRKDLEDLKLNKNDLVIGLAASGRTPYVIGGLNYADSIGCHTASICCNADSPVGKAAEQAVDVVTGPEVLTGSTRLKAGTCEKLILNMISTAAMAGIGKTYSNLMIDVMQTNEKLMVRAETIVMEATGVDRALAREKIDEAGGSCKTAVTMILSGCTREEAEKSLKDAGGHVRQAIKGTFRKGESHDN